MSFKCAIHFLIDKINMNKTEAYYYFFESKIEIHQARCPYEAPKILKNLKAEYLINVTEGRLRDRGS